VAYEMFTDFGIEAFAERANIELRATGEHARRRAVDALDPLTPQEAQISDLVVQGSTNREIAAQLFISASTVEHHLHKAFPNLGVRSRTEPARRMKKKSPSAQLRSRRRRLKSRTKDFLDSILLTRGQRSVLWKPIRNSRDARRPPSITPVRLRVPSGPSDRAWTSRLLVAGVRDERN
jgi:DNA-binding CsgD family transcriptional regulator